MAHFKFFVAYRVAIVFKIPLFKISFSECSKFVIALISKDYLNSKVCIEELCLSIVLQLQNNCKIWPLVIEPLEESIEWLDTLSPLNCYKGSGEERNISISLVCNEFLAALKGNTGHIR